MAELELEVKIESSLEPGKQNLVCQLCESCKQKELEERIEK